VWLLGEPLAVRPSFDALLERVSRNFTGIGLPKTEGPEGLTVEVILTPEEAPRGVEVPIAVPGVESCFEAVELARMTVDIIFATSSTESEPARRATNTIPIVFATHADPVGVGHVSSLARPGGNMTGLADIQPDITPKRWRS
jgi:hypothetical protein